MPSTSADESTTLISQFQSTKFLDLWFSGKLPFYYSDLKPEEQKAFRDFWITNAKQFRKDVPDIATGIDRYINKQRGVLSKFTKNIADLLSRPPNPKTPNANKTLLKLNTQLEDLPKTDGPKLFTLATAIQTGKDLDQEWDISRNFGQMASGSAITNLVGAFPATILAAAITGAALIQWGKQVSGLLTDRKETIPTYPLEEGELPTVASKIEAQLMEAGKAITKKEEEVQKNNPHQIDVQPLNLPPHQGFTPEPPENPSGARNFPSSAPKIRKTPLPFLFDGSKEKFLKWQAEWKLFISGENGSFSSRAGVGITFASTIAENTMAHRLISIALQGSAVQGSPHYKAFEESESDIQLIGYLLRILAPHHADPKATEEALRNIGRRQGNMGISEFLAHIHEAAWKLGYENRDIASRVIEGLNPGIKLEIATLAGKKIHTITYKDVMEFGPEAEQNMEIRSLSDDFVRKKRTERKEGKPTSSVKGRAATLTPTKNSNVTRFGKKKRFSDEDYQLIRNSGACFKCFNVPADKEHKSSSCTAQQRENPTPGQLEYMKRSIEKKGKMNAVPPPVKARKAETKTKTTASKDTPDSSEDESQ